MLCDYDCFRKWTKLLTYLVALSIVAVGITRVMSLFTAIVLFDYIINAYLMVLGVVLFLAECEMQFLLKHFMFLKYYFGKAFLITFVGFLCLNSNPHPFYIAISALCFAVAFSYLVIGFACFGSEREFYGGEKVSPAAYGNTQEVPRK